MDGWMAAAKGYFGVCTVILEPVVVSSHPLQNVGQLRWSLLSSTGPAAHAGYPRVAPKPSLPCMATGGARHGEGSPVVMKKMVHVQSSRPPPTASATAAQQGEHSRARTSRRRTWSHFSCVVFCLQQMLDFPLPPLLRSRWLLLLGETRGGSRPPSVPLLPASSRPPLRKRRGPTTTTLMKPVRTPSFLPFSISLSLSCLRLTPYRYNQLLVIRDTCLFRGVFVQMSCVPTVSTLLCVDTHVMLLGFSFSHSGLSRVRATLRPGEQQSPL